LNIAAKQATDQLVPAVAFELSGVTTLLRSPFEDGLAGLPPTYARHQVPSPSAPALVIDVEHVPELGARPRAPDHPAFARRRDGDTLLVERGDAEGRIDLGGTPMRARFRISGDRYALEACVRVALSVALPRHGALILHASAVKWRGTAHVFTGVSGAGKSTIAVMLDTLPGCERLADELLVIARAGDGWDVLVPPFLGIDGLPRGDRAPLASIDLLVQAPMHRRAALAPAEALRELLRHVVVYAAEPDTTARVLALTSALVAGVACHRLEFAKDPSVGAILGALP
jgi:hypothetical protein